MKAQPLTVYLPDTRGVTLGRYGLGNLKIGPGVYTYSRPPGNPFKPALGEAHHAHGTCPGATKECQAICYARRPMEEDGVVAKMWRSNEYEAVPEIPEDAKMLRIHVSGDFDSNAYIEEWIDLLTARPDVVTWAYTRSWRIPELLAALERLRALPNVQLFASMDPSTEEMPPPDWRRAWIWRSFDTAVKGNWPMEDRLSPLFLNEEGDISQDNMVVTDDGTSAYICPEETQRKANCVECGYCLRGKKHDVVFIEH